MKITRSYTGQVSLQYGNFTPFNRHQEEVVVHGVECFSHLIPRGATLNANDLADLIEDRYTTDDPKIKDTVELLRVSQ